MRIAIFIILTITTIILVVQQGFRWIVKKLRRKPNERRQVNDVV